MQVIQQGLSPPYWPESSGKAERLNRTLNHMARAMIISLSSTYRKEELWAEAVYTASYVRNGMFTNGGNQGEKTPFEAILGRKPHMRRVKRSGIRAYVHVPKVRRHSKFEARASVLILVGYVNGDSYESFFRELNRFVLSRDVQFNASIIGTSHLVH